MANGKPKEMEIQTSEHMAPIAHAMAKIASEDGVKTTVIEGGMVSVYNGRAGGERRLSGSTKAYADGWDKFLQRRAAKAAAQQGQHDKANLS